MKIERRDLDEFWFQLKPNIEFLNRSELPDSWQALRSLQTGAAHQMPDLNKPAPGFCGGVSSIAAEQARHQASYTNLVEG